MFDVLEPPRRKNAPPPLQSEMYWFLKLFPYLKIDAAVSFSVKSTRFNETAVKAENVESTDLYIDLNGVGGEKYVSRNDLRTLTMQASQQLQSESIVEVPTNFNDTLLLNIISRSETVVGNDLFFQTNEGANTFNEADLTPDAIKKVLNNIYQKDSGKDQWSVNAAAAASGSYLGIGASGSGSYSKSELTEYLHEHDIDVEIDGDIIIPKSIQLHKVNVSSLLSSFNASLEYRDISGSPKIGMKTQIEGAPPANIPVESSYLASCSIGQRQFLQLN